MIFTVKACSDCRFKLIKGNVARYTNSQVHRLHLATAPMGTLVTGFNNEFNKLNKLKMFVFLNVFAKFVEYLTLVF